MEQPFLREPVGSDFAANPFAGLPEREGRTVVPDTPAGSPLSHFDLMELLGGPADIAAMQREIEVIAGPLNLDVPGTSPEEAAAAVSQPAASARTGELPTGDEIAAMIADMLEHGPDHAADRVAFCHQLGYAIADSIASSVAASSMDDHVPAP